MSDFASLLKSFQAAASQPSAAHEIITTRKAVKRSRSLSSYGGKHKRVPRDSFDLSVNVDFLCIGAQKAGTTWLHDMLRKIPQLGLPKSKEVHFWDWYRRKGLKWYSQQFPRDPNTNLILGEVTPCYMALKGYQVKEIHELFPRIRIVFIARDLVDRAWSALTMELRNQARGLRPGEFDVDYDQMDASTRDKLLRHSDPSGYNDEYFMAQLKSCTHTDRSDYASGLSRFLQHFPREQILVLNFRDVSENPKLLLSQVLHHVGMKNVTSALENVCSEDLERRVNSSIVQNQVIRPSLRRKMEKYLQPYVCAFNSLLKSHWPEITWALDDYSQSIQLSEE